MMIMTRCSRDSLVSLFVILGVLTAVAGVGGDVTASFNDGSNVNGDSSMCRVIRDSKKSLLQYFRSRYTASDSVCDLSNHCSNVTCAAYFTRWKVNAGLVLDLCQDDPTLQYWVDIPGQWDQPWNHVFSSKDFNGKVQRAEITGNQNDTTSQSKSTKWFIKVLFSITSGRNQVNHLSKYISIESELQICQNSAAEDSCTNTTLLKFPRLPQVQICDFITETPSDSSQDEEKGALPSSSRSSRNANANAWDPQQFHRQAAVNVLKYQNGQLLPATPGDSCNIEDIFACGPGASCTTQPNGSGSGTCQCLPGYTKNATSGICSKKSATPITPSDHTSNADSSNSSSYTSAFGAIIAIILLAALAAAVFFGTKYQVYQRFRHRIPVLRCWPFRRSQPWEDNVTMVNPLGPPDDDDPPLL